MKFFLKFLSVFYGIYYLKKKSMLMALIETANSFQIQYQSNERFHSGQSIIFCTVFYFANFLFVYMCGKSNRNACLLFIYDDNDIRFRHCLYFIQININMRNVTRHPHSETIQWITWFGFVHCSYRMKMYHGNKITKSYTKRGNNKKNVRWDVVLRAPKKKNFSHKFDMFIWYNSLH